MNTGDGAPKIEIKGADHPEASRVLTPEASSFVAKLHRTFNPRRTALLTARLESQRARDAGDDLAFLEATREIRESEWTVAPPPSDLQNRRVEITGPVDRKMVINALNSEARVFMADFEDANSPTWSNCLSGQANLYDAIRRQVDFSTPEGKEYKLRDEVATLLVRPRGWHLPEKHFEVDGEAISASLFDFGLYFFHNAQELCERGSGPYFYLPKLESHLEARLWNDVFRHAQDELGIPQGTVRATVLIETISAAFEMEEILWELRDHSSGLNAGRWDYIFSVIRAFGERDVVLPDRDQITMTVPFMEAYTELLIRTSHKRGAHAIGGMAAFIPNRRDPEVTRHALAKVREDKEREARAGCDGTWVAHPDLVPVAIEIFDRALGTRANQIEKLREEVEISSSELADFRVSGGRVTEAGVRKNIGIALRYLQAWLAGRGAAAIDNLMEDAATAEISRAQLWQWRTHRVRLDDGREFDSDRYRELREEELSRLRDIADRRLEQAVEILDRLVLDDTFAPFLTLPAYEKLD